MKQFQKDDRGLRFYLQALQCAQSLWCQGYPAQSILLMDRALGADLKQIHSEFPFPYAAIGWVIQHRPDSYFIGNPRRHFQHYATRVSGPRRQIRKWRAWACWFIASRILSAVEFPDDEKQIAEETIVLPSHGEIYESLLAHGLPGEADLWDSVLAGDSEE